MSRATKHADTQLARAEDGRGVVMYVDPPGSIRLVFPWSLLVADNRKATVRGGKITNSKAYRSGKEQIEQHAREQYHGPTLVGRLEVTVDVIEPDRKRTRDILNLSKQWGDALTGIIYVDDGQIDRAHVYRHAPNRARAGIVITIHPTGT